MKKTCWTLCCVLGMLLWLGMAGPAAAWSFGQDQVTSGGDAQQNLIGDGPQPRLDLENDNRGSGGSGLQIFPLILIIPLGWFFLRRILRHHGRDDQDGQNSRNGQQDNSGQDSQMHGEDPENLQEAYRRARAQWEWMTGGDAAAPGGAKSAGTAASSVSAPGAASGGFDINDFLRGAKLVYAQLTEAFDNLDADAAAPFADEAVLEGLRTRAASGARPGNTEIVLVEAELLEHTNTQDAEEAVVLYDALVRRGPDAAEPEQLRQVWRFARDPRDPASMWRLMRMESYSDPAS